MLLSAAAQALGGSEKASFFLHHTDLKWASFILKQAVMDGVTALRLGLEVSFLSAGNLRLLGGLETLFFDWE